MRKLLLIALFLVAASLVWAALPATDTFGRADWTSLNSYGTWSYISGNTPGWFNIYGQAQPDINNGTWYTTGVIWTGDTFNNDQYAQATVADIAAIGSFDAAGLLVRSGTSGTNGNPSTGYSCIAWRSGKMEIHRQDTGAALNSSTSAWPGSGATMRCEVSGSTITMTYGARTLTATDSTFTSGSTGIICWYQGYDGTKYDNWQTGNLSGGVVPGAVRPRPLIMSWRKRW